MPIIYAKYNEKIVTCEQNIPPNGNFKLCILDNDDNNIVSPDKGELVAYTEISMELIKVMIHHPLNFYFIAGNDLEHDFFDLMRFARNDHPLKEDNFIQAEISNKNNDYILKIKAKRVGAIFEKEYVHTFQIIEPFNYQNETVVTMYEVYKNIKHLFSGVDTEEFLNKVLHVFWAFINEKGKTQKTIVFSDTL